MKSFHLQLMTLAFSILHVITYAQSHNKPLLVVQKGKDAIITQELLIKSQDIDSIHIYKGSAEVAKYQERGKYGVVFIKLKTNTQTLTYNQLVKQYHIQRSLRSLPVYVDTTYLKNKNEFIAQLSEVKDVYVALADSLLPKHIQINSHAYYKEQLYQKEHPNEKRIIIR